MLKAKDVMTTHVVTISGSATVADAVKLMNEKGLRALIVDRRTGGDSLWNYYRNRYCLQGCGLR